MLVVGFFAYQGSRSLTLRRLILAEPTTSAAHLRSGVGTNTCRKRSRVSRVERVERVEREEMVASCGCTFGFSLGNVVAYLQGRRIPCERVHILNRIRAILAPAAQTLTSMTGADAPFLRLGFGSLLVVGAQRAHLPELAPGAIPKLDARYARAHVAIGATAAIIASVGVMASVKEDARHLERDSSLSKVLRCAECHLRFWKTSHGLSLPAEHFSALQAERRALQRAVVGAEAAAEAGADMERQIERALAAAFPAACNVDAVSHADLCARAKRDGGATDAVASAASNGIVPLALIAGLVSGTRASLSDDSGSISSSRFTPSSAMSSATSASSAASVRSADSFDAVLVSSLSGVSVER